MSDIDNLTARELEYLLIIFKHSRAKGYVRQIEILQELRVDKSTASLMVKKLVKKGYLIVYKRQIVLAERGRRAIREILWRHGVLENVLVKLGISLREACAVTWDILDKIPKKMLEYVWARLGKPNTCPCGYHFPSVDREDELEKFDVCLTCRRGSSIHGS